MHELPLTEEIVRLASNTAREKKGWVRAIELVLGQDSGYVGESVQMYFDVISQGTLCEGARLEVLPVRPQLKCRSCGEYFYRKPFAFTCPKCGGEGQPTEIGKEFYIKSLELELPD